MYTTSFYQCKTLSMSNDVCVPIKSLTGLLKLNMIYSIDTPSHLLGREPTVLVLVEMCAHMTR